MVDKRLFAVGLLLVLSLFLFVKVNPTGFDVLTLDEPIEEVSPASVLIFEEPAILNEPLNIQFSGSGDGSSGNPYQITNCTQLQEMNDNPGAYYVLGENINCTYDTQDPFGALWNSGAGFSPITLFAGSFDGQNYTIAGLHINRPSTQEIGLLGRSIGTIKNMRLEGVNVSGEDYVGGLVGYNEGIINSTYSAGNVIGNSSVGGLVGMNVGENSEGIATITNSYSTANVSGHYYIGGLVGSLCDFDAFFHDNNLAPGIIINSYSTGSVSGTDHIGGLLGANNLYETTPGPYYCLGRGGWITSSYWDNQTSGQSTSAGGEGRTTFEMMAQSNFVDWDFVDAWSIDEGVSYPTLLWQIESTCRDITTPNSIYTLWNDVGSSGTCFNITANNVTLDCQGFTIANTGYMEGAGILINGVSNATIRSCTINGFGTGIGLNYSNYSNITGVNITAGSSQTGLFFYSSSYNQLKDSFVTSDSKCILLNASSNNNSFVSNTIFLDISYYAGTYSKYLAVDATGVGNKITNTSFITDYGVNIRFPNQILLPNGGDINWNNFISTSLSMGINSTDIPFMNDSAEIKFYYINTTNPTPIFMDWDLPALSECTEADGCQIVYDNRTSGVFIFNVSHFSSYAVLGTPLSDLTGDYDCTFTSGSMTFPGTMQLTQNNFDVGITLDIPEAGFHGILDGFVGGFETEYGSINYLFATGTAESIKIGLEGGQALLLGNVVTGGFNTIPTSDDVDFTCTKRTPTPSSGGGGGGGGGGGTTVANVTVPVVCVENWECSNFSVCADSLQTRTCSDVKSCGTTTNKPSESQSCQMPAPIIPKKSNLWIYILLISLAAALLIGSFLSRGRLYENSLKKKIAKMEGFLASNDLEGARNSYMQIRNTYKKLPVKSEAKYHDKIIMLYQKALGY